MKKGFKKYTRLSKIWESLKLKIKSIITGWFYFILSLDGGSPSIKLLAGYKGVLLFQRTNILVTVKIAIQKVAILRTVSVPNCNYTINKE